MDFELSDEQQALAAAARRLLDDHASPARVRAAVARGSGYDEKLWTAMVEQGWLGIAVPEQFGGVGLGVVELVILLEALGAHTAPAPLLGQALIADAVVRAGGGHADPLLEHLLDGSTVACAAFTPGRAPVLYAPSAGAVVARLAPTDAAPDGVGVALVDLPAAARPEPEPAMDRTRELGWLETTGRGRQIGGPDAATRLVDLGALAHAAEMLGAAAHMLEVAVAYAKERVQFGQPIGSFQAVKHRCADMLVDVEGMRSAVYHAAWCVGVEDPDASVAASTAKVWCSDASRRVMASALQVHGGLGFTWEHETHLYLKRAQLDQVSFGDATFHRERLTRLLRARLEAGLPVL